MNSEHAILPDLGVSVEAIGRGWPEQIIPHYEGYWAAWRKAIRSVSVATDLSHYRTMGHHWCKFANGKVLNPQLMLDWHQYAASIRSNKGNKNKIKELISSTRLARYHSTIKKFLRWLKLTNVIEADPSLVLPLIIREPKGPVKLWLHQEYLATVANCSNLPSMEPIVWLIVLGYHTGMSRTDCCHLQWSEVVLSDEGPSYIQKARAKMRSRLGARAIFTLPIVAGSELWVWIKRLEARRVGDCPWVHPMLPGIAASKLHPYIHQRIRRAFVKGVGGRNMKGRTFRHLRNSFCSRLINSGADSLLVSKMTGHQNLKQLGDYVLPNIRAMSEAIVTALRWAADESGEKKQTEHFLIFPTTESKTWTPPQ